MVMLYLFLCKVDLPHIFCAGSTMTFLWSEWMAWLWNLDLKDTVAVTT